MCVDEKFEVREREGTYDSLELRSEVCEPWMFLEEKHTYDTLELQSYVSEAYLMRMGLEGKNTHVEFPISSFLFQVLFEILS
jgi:hypothetical protein